MPGRNKSAVCKHFFIRVLLYRPLLGGRPSLGHRCQLLLAFKDLLGNIEPAIACAILDDIGVAVITRTDDIKVFGFLPEASRQGRPYTVSLLVDRQAPEEIIRERPVRVQVVTAFLRVPAQPLE